MEWMNKMRRFWSGAAIRLGFRKTGLFGLRHDIRRCEYEDIHILWEIAQRHEMELAQRYAKNKKREPFWNLFKWTCCRF